MKIVKLNDSQFYFEAEDTSNILDWEQLLLTLNDIEDYLEDTDIGELIAELASYKNGATKVL